MKKQAFNPYLPSYEYVPDGEPYVFGDRVYVFGSHDAFDGEGFCVNDYVCWSAPTEELGDWKYEGVIFRRHPGSADGRETHADERAGCMPGAGWQVLSVSAGIHANGYHGGSGGSAPGAL